MLLFFIFVVSTLLFELQLCLRVELYLANCLLPSEIIIYLRRHLASPNPVLVAFARILPQPKLPNFALPIILGCAILNDVDRILHQQRKRWAPSHSNGQSHYISRDGAAASKPLRRASERHSTWRGGPRAAVAKLPPPVTAFLALSPDCMLTLVSSSAGPMLPKKSM